MKKSAFKETVNRLFEVKAVEEQGKFSGLAAVYSNVDFGGDMIKPGAFTKNLAEQGNRRPLRDGHKFPVGLVTLSDSDIGLEAHGQLNLEKQSARDLHSDLKFFQEHGLPYGMSIGFLPVPGKTQIDSKGICTYSELVLFEVSLTDMPLNGEARVISVKDGEDRFIENFTELLSEVKAGRAISAARMRRLREIMEEISALMVEAGGDATSEPEAAGKSIEPAKIPLGLLDCISQMQKQAVQIRVIKGGSNGTA